MALKNNLNLIALFTVSTLSASSETANQKDTLLKPMPTLSIKADDDADTIKVESENADSLNTHNTSNNNNNKDLLIKELNNLFDQAEKLAHPNTTGASGITMKQAKTANKQRLDIAHEIIQKLKALGLGERSKVKEYESLHEEAQKMHDSLNENRLTVKSAPPVFKKSRQLMEKAAPLKNELIGL